MASEVYNRAYGEGERLFGVIVGKLPKEQRRSATVDLIAGLTEAIKDCLYEDEEEN